MCEDSRAAADPAASSDPDSADHLWAIDRVCPYAMLPSDAALPEAWTFSAARLQQIRNVLRQTELPDCVACIAVSGSLSRMEADRQSDLDLLIVLDDRTRNLPPEAGQRAQNSVWNAIEAVGMQPPIVRPKPGGIFSACVSWHRIVDAHRRGVIDDDLLVFGQRMQLLIDAQPVLNAQNFIDLQHSILEWYSEQRIARLFDEPHPFHWLWQDVQRYWRSIRSRANWLHADQPARSLEVNFKLRFSRLVLIAAILAAVSRCPSNDGQQDPTDDSLSAAIRFLQHSLTWTPLERLVRLQSQNAAFDSADARQLIAGYQRAWMRSRTLLHQPDQFGFADHKVLADLNAVVRRLACTDAPEWWF